MLKRKTRIREAIIPDISVKLLNLCLGEDENGILMPITQRKTKDMDFRADWALQNVIKERIEKKALPLVLRKKQLYENSIICLEIEKKQPSLDYLFKNGPAPIMMRKHLLNLNSRAG